MAEITGPITPDPIVIAGEAISAERRRIVGFILSQWAHYRQMDQFAIADALDTLALRIEHGDDSFPDVVPSTQNRKG